MIYEFVPQIRPDLRQATSSLNHYSLISLPPDTVQAGQLTALLRSHNWTNKYTRRIAFQNTFLNKGICLYLKMYFVVSNYRTVFRRVRKIAKSDC